MPFFYLHRPFRPRRHPFVFTRGPLFTTPSGGMGASVTLRASSALSRVGTLHDAVTRQISLVSLARPGTIHGVGFAGVMAATKARTGAVHGSQTHFTQSFIAAHGGFQAALSRQILTALLGRAGGSSGGANFLAILPRPRAPEQRPREERHWTDQLILTLQQREAVYNTPVATWDATTATLMGAIDDDSVHERWDDTVVGADLRRQGHRLASTQTRAFASTRLQVTQPRVTPHTLAGLLGLTLGQITSEQQQFLTAYRHTITLAPPTQLPSISAQIGHQSNLYTIYPGIKSDGFTLSSNGPYVSLRCELVGSGAHQDATGTTRFQSLVLVSDITPNAQRITDELGGSWYLSPDGAGGLTIDTVAPTGVTLPVGTGLSLLAVDGWRYRVGISSGGSIEITPVVLENLHVVEAFAIRDATDVVWYLWIEDQGPTIDTNPPPPLPVPIEEVAVRWGNSRFYLADVTEEPVVLGVPIQGATTLGAGAVDISNRVVSLQVMGTNGLLATDAYRVGGGNVRSNFHAAQQALSVQMALQVQSATEAADLRAYLDQRHLALEWQCLGEVLDPVEINVIAGSGMFSFLQILDSATGLLPAYHQITDSRGGTWYLTIQAGGTIGLEPDAPTEAGIVVGTGLVLWGLDGWHAALGASPLGEVIVIPLSDDGVPAAVEVCTLRTREGEVWYLWIDALGQLTVSDTMPSPGVNLTVVPPSVSTLWYVSIDTLGEVVVSRTLPAGQGLVCGMGLDLRALDGWEWRLGVDVLGEGLATQHRFVGTTPHVIDVMPLLDSNGLPWYLWMDGLGSYVVSRTPVSVEPWQMGLTLIVPHMQYRAIVRTEQQQFDVLELTGTVLEDRPDEPVVVAVYNRQPQYLQLA